MPFIPIQVPTRERGLPGALADILKGFTSTYLPRMLEKRKEERALKAKTEESAAWSKWLEGIPSTEDQAGRVVLGELPELVTYSSGAPDPIAGAQYVRQLKGLEATGIRVGDRLELQRERLEWQKKIYIDKDFKVKRDTSIKLLDSQGMLPAPGSADYEPAIMNMMFILDQMPEEYEKISKQMAVGPSPEEKFVPAPALWDKKRMKDAWIEYYKGLGYTEAEMLENPALLTNIRSKVKSRLIPQAAFPTK
jgi:hypothetical protein